MVKIGFNAAFEFALLFLWKLLNLEYVDFKLSAREDVLIMNWPEKQKLLESNYTAYVKKIPIYSFVSWK